MGYDQDDGVVFKGMIVKHGVQVRKDGQCLLVPPCADSAARMTAVRKSAVFRSQSDSAIWQALREAHGLQLTTGRPAREGGRGVGRGPGSRGGAAFGLGAR